MDRINNWRVYLGACLFLLAGIYLFGYVIRPAPGQLVIEQVGTTNSYDAVCTVIRITNVGKHDASFTGYDKSYPFIGYEEMCDGAWEKQPAGRCGTGARLWVLRSGESIEFPGPTVTSIKDEAPLRLTISYCTTALPDYVARDSYKLKSLLDNGLAFRPRRETAWSLPLTTSEDI